MRNKSLLILTPITLILIIATMVVTNNRAPQKVIEKQPLSSELKSRVNDVSQIIIESSENAVHITKAQNDWVLMQADNYPARFEKVKKLVLDIANLYILSRKTSNPDLFPELGVQDYTEQNANSILLTFLDGMGNTIISIIIGNSRTQGGFYIRTAGSYDTYLVAGQRDVAVNPTEWIEKSLLNIENERISQAIIEHPDGGTLSLMRDEETKNFLLTGIPQGRKSRSEYFTNQPGTFLSDLSIENAKNRETFTFTQTQTKTTIKTYDGLIANISSAKIDNQNYIALQFLVNETLIDQSKNNIENDTIVIGEQAPDEINIVQEAEQLNDKVRKWVFTIPQSKYLLLTKRIEELTDSIEQ